MQSDVEVSFTGFFGRITSTLLLVVVLAGCVAVKPRAADVVKERAQARWDALVKGDTKAAYAFLSPASRAQVTPEGYATSIRAGFWKSAVVDKVICASSDACEAQVTIEYEFQAKRMKTPLRETWIREETDWWYLLK